MSVRDVSRPVDVDRAPPRLETVFRDHHDFVWRLAASMGAPSGAVDDTVQEVFLVVARKLPDYVDTGNIRAWLAAITRRVLADARKKRTRADAREEASAPPTPHEDPEDAVARRQGAQVMRAFLESLPDEQREAFVLMEIEGMSAPQVAQILEVRPNTVYSRLRLARRRFEQVCNQWSQGKGAAS